MLSTVDLRLDEGMPLLGSASRGLPSDGNGFEMAPIHTAKASLESPTKTQRHKDKQDLTDRLILSVYDRGRGYFLSFDALSLQKCTKYSIILSVKRLQIQIILRNMACVASELESYRGVRNCIITASKIYFMAVASRYN